MAEKSAGSKEKAARAERNPEPKSLEFKGVEFTFPAEFPDWLRLDFFELTELANGGAVSSIKGKMLTLLKGLLNEGAEGQYEVFRAAVRNPESEIQTDDLEDLLIAAFGAYGVTPGESSASQST